MKSRRESSSSRRGWSEALDSIGRLGRIAGVMAFVAATLVAAGTDPVAAATFTVTRTDDPAPDGCNSGVDCSLREAVIDANASPGPDVIALGSGTYELTIPGSLENAAATGDLDLTDDLTIDGIGPSGTVVSASGLAGGRDRVFHVRGAVTVAINDLAITGGVAPTAEPAGGGILQEDGSLSLGGVLLTENHNLSTGVIPNEADGGGVATLDGALSVVDSIISNNSTNDDGGGIAIAAGSLDLTRTLLAENTSTGPGSQGGSSTDGARGGGLSVGAAATGTIADVTISYNSVLDTDEYSGGGGLFIAGSVDASDLVVDFNQVESFGGGGLISETGSLTATSLEVEQNGAGGAGGGLAVQGSLDATGGRIFANTAGGAGAMIIGSNDGPMGDVSLVDVEVDGNGATVVGGVFVFPGAVLSLSGGSVASNRASGGPAGGLFNGGRATLADTEFIKNEASGGGAGILNAETGTLDATAISVLANDARPGLGGGILSLGETTLDRVAVAGNLADVAGSGIIVGDGSFTATDLAVLGNGGELQLGGGLFAWADVGTPTIELERAVFTGHSVTDGGGGVAMGGGARGAFTNVTVSGNDVTGGSGSGGGILVADTGTTLDLGFSTIVDNAAVSGGGLVARDGATLGSLASLISDNGGGDCATFSSATLMSNGHNVDGDGSCGFGGPNDLSAAGPMLGDTLGPLADNGGWESVMLTHALLPTNPAIDRATSPGCPSSDGRGAVRPAGPGCDSGAFEAPAAAAGSDHRLTIDKDLVGEVEAGGDARWHITIENTGTDPAPGRLTFADTLPDAVSFSSVAADDWDCSVAGQTITCFHDGDLDPGAETELEIVGAIVGGAGADVTNTAGVSTFGSVSPVFATAPGEVLGSGSAAEADDPPAAGEANRGGPSGAGRPGPPVSPPATGSSIPEVAAPAGSLPATGSPVPEVIVGALLAIGLGILLVGAGRRARLSPSRGEFSRSAD